MASDMSVEINNAMDRVMEKNEKIKMKKYANKMTEKEFELYTTFIHGKFGMEITENKRHMLEIKINRLMNQNKFEDYITYYNMISTTKDKQKIVELLNEITINKTDFFREINHFNFMKSQLSFIMKKNHRIDGAKEIRVWSSASSTGEEPYTLAIVLKEILPPNISIKILATDISHRVLEKAILGEYSNEIKTQVDPILLTKYFNKTKVGYEVKQELKEMVTFRSFNLKEPFPFKNKFDIIFCRNVMIYFDREFQEKLVNKFYDSTINGGLLFIGHSESLTYIKNRYKYYQPTIYLKE
jgi:chemotaxis protein methyltransferase CheR